MYMLWVIGMEESGSEKGSLSGVEVDYYQFTAK